MAFVGDPPLFRPPPNTPVYVSVTFTWDIPEGERLKRAWSDYFSDVQIGGPAFGDPGGEFIPGRFVKDGVTITSRGCPKKCDFCFVPKREGAIRELDIKSGWTVQDNSLLACSREHIEKVFAMLKKQPEPISFNGGLDTLFLAAWHRPLFDSIRLKDLWFACDYPAALKPLQKAAYILNGISVNKLRCYVLIGHKNETIFEAEGRLEAVYRLGFLPFAQLYKSEGMVNHSKEWKALARKWSRPAIYRAAMKERINAD
jgi:hypothetical protein